jgi:hypothetical protein
MKLYRRLALSLGLLAACLATVAAQTEVPAIADQCRQDLAQRLSVPLAEITVEQAKAVTFPDGSLGLSRPGEMYTQALVAGYSLTLKASNWQYLYTASERSFRYGGPLDAWACSALYIEAIPDEPNMNGNLVQVSLVGTNPRTLLREVSDVWPQPDGGLLAKRRTSRSGHELLFLAPQPEAEVVRLAGAMDFVAAATNSAATQWAAVIRPRLGAGWELTIGALATPEQQDRQGFQLPDGARPLGLWWDQEQPVVLMTLNDKAAYYQLAGDEGGWDKLGWYDPPGAGDFVLSKSETLTVETVEVDGKPVTQVSRVWFTGDAHPMARIAGLAMSEAVLSSGQRFLLVTGRQDDKLRAYTVDIATGEVLPTTPEGIRGPVKLYLIPPRDWLEFGVVTNDETGG